MQTACYLYTVSERQRQTIETEPTPSNHERCAAAVRRGGSDESDFANGLKVQRHLEASGASERERRAIRTGGEAAETPVELR